MERLAVSPQKKSTVGETVLFWLGIAYMLVLVCAMTPLTHQLDDIKVVVLHVFGPILTIAYLLFLTFGQVRPPRKGILVTLGAYYLLITITTLSIHDFRKWLAWEGFWMQWALLGPFLAFMASVCNKKKNHQIMMFLGLLTCLTTVFGLAHRGMYGMESGATLIAESKMGDIKSLQAEFKQLQRDFESGYASFEKMPEGLEKNQQAQKLTVVKGRYDRIISEMRSREELLRNSFSYKIFSTLSGAKTRMMSLILNRNFYASFLLLLLPFVIAGIAIVPPVPWKIFTWIALFFVFVFGMLDLTTGSLTKMIPGTILGGSMMLLCIPLMMGTLSQWFGKKNGIFALFGFIVVIGIGLLMVHNKEMAEAGNPKNAIWLICLMLPVAGYAIWTLVDGMGMRVASLIAMVFGLVCMFAGRPVGGALFIFAPMLTVSLMKIYGATWRIAMGATLVMGLFCLYYTKSKASMFICFEAEILLMVVMWWFASRQRRRVKMGIVVGAVSIVLLAITLFFISPAGSEAIGRLNEGFVKEQMKDFGNPLNSRRIIWSGAVGIWKDHPILGAGLKSFLVLFPEHRHPDYFLYEISHVTIFAHSFFLDVLAESGLLGFMALMAFFAFMYLKATKRALREHDWKDRMLAVCTIAGVTGFFLSNLASPNARWPICAGVIWAVLGIMAGIVNRRMQSDETAVENPPWVPSEKARAVVLIMALLSVGGWIYTTVYSYNFFLGSMNNNEGLGVIGNPPEQLGMLYQAKQGALSIAGQYNREQDPKKREQIFNQLENAKQAYNKYRNYGLNKFQTALDYNPSFITSYYKKASLQSMGNDPLQYGTADDLRAALRTYADLCEFAPNFSQVHYNIGMLNAQLFENERTTEKNPVILAGYENEAIAHFRVAASETIESAQTEGLCRLLMTKGAKAKWEFTESDISDFDALGKAIEKGRHPLAKEMAVALKKNGAGSLREATQSSGTKAAIIAELNRLRLDKNLFSEDRFQGVKLSKRTRNRLKAQPTGTDLERLNRTLLVQAFPGLVKPHPYDEICEATARTFFWWNRLFVNDVRVRRSDADVMSNIWKTALVYVRYAIDTKHFEEATDVILELNGLPAADLAIGSQSENSKVGFGAAISRMVASLEPLNKHEELGRFLKAIVDTYPNNENARFRYAINLCNREKMGEAKKQATIYKKMFATQKDNAVYLDFYMAKAAGNDSEAFKIAGNFVESATDAALKADVRKYLKDRADTSKVVGPPAPPIVIEPGTPNTIPAPGKTPTPVK